MNLLIIVADTFRWDYLGAYGNEWIKTPCLEQHMRRHAPLTQGSLQPLAEDPHALSFDALPRFDRKR